MGIKFSFSDLSSSFKDAVIKVTTCFEQILFVQRAVDVRVGGAEGRDEHGKNALLSETDKVKFNVPLSILCIMRCSTPYILWSQRQCC